MLMASETTTGGNMAMVRAATSNGQIVDYEGRNKLDAEIVAGVTPAWYVIETTPGHQKIAAAHLSARRFGIYVPEVETDEMRRGRRVKSLHPMFRGYIFVFLWGINRHYGRVLACPGVLRFVLIEDNPAIISDADIARIKAVENKHRPLSITLELIGYPKKKKRWRNSNKTQEERLREERFTENEIVAVYTKSYWTGIETLDDDGRNQALRRALGLA